LLIKLKKKENFDLKIHHRKIYTRFIFVKWFKFYKIFIVNLKRRNIFVNLVNIKGNTYKKNNFGLASITNIVRRDPTTKEYFFYKFMGLVRNMPLFKRRWVLYIHGQLYQYKVIKKIIKENRKLFDGFIRNSPFLSFNGSRKKKLRRLKKKLRNVIKKKGRKYTQRSLSKFIPFRDVAYFKNFFKIKKVKRRIRRFRKKKSKIKKFIGRSKFHKKKSIIKKFKGVHSFLRPKSKRMISLEVKKNFSRKSKLKAIRKIFIRYGKKKRSRKLKKVFQFLLDKLNIQKFFPKNSKFLKLERRYRLWYKLRDNLLPRAYIRQKIRGKVLKEINEKIFMVRCLLTFTAPYIPPEIYNVAIISKKQKPVIVGKNVEKYFPQYYKGRRYERVPGELFFKSDLYKHYKKEIELEIFRYVSRHKRFDPNFNFKKRLNQKIEKRLILPKDIDGIFRNLRKMFDDVPKYQDMALSKFLKKKARVPRLAKSFYEYFMKVVKQVKRERKNFGRHRARKKRMMKKFRKRVSR
jgi:hypothetical protein